MSAREPKRKVETAPSYVLRTLNTAEAYLGMNPPVTTSQLARMLRRSIRLMMDKKP